MGRKSSSKKRKEVSGKVRKWLSQLLLDLQHENLEELTMDDIARLAGKSKSTIYEYFKSKEEILRAACETKTTAILTAISELQQQEMDTIERYSHLIEIFAGGTTGISFPFLQSIKCLPEQWRTSFVRSSMRPQKRSPA